LERDLIMAEPKQADKVVKMSKDGKRETFELKDKGGKIIETYTFQFPGVLKTQELVDESTNGYGATVTKDYNEALMKHVIIEPKTNWPYWDEHEGYRRVMEAADRFLGKLLR
jgi:hypothetical protein